MKRAFKLGHSAITMTQWTRWIAVPFIALAYCRAAQRAEQSGCEFTAAMNWRKAATLMSGGRLASHLCWKQWERIMRLPRRLAVPIGAVAVEQSQSDVHQRIQPAPESSNRIAVAHVPLASAA